MQGIYGIYNKVEKRWWYVGQSTDIETRWNAHKYGTYEEGNWHNEIQARLDDFKFEILELVDDVDDLRDREDYYIDLYNPKCTSKKANKGSFVGPLSAETKDKISASLKGHPVSDETKSKISANNCAKRPEVRAKISATNSEIMHSPEVRAKISANNGMKQPDVRAKVSASLKGHPSNTAGAKWMHTPNGKSIMVKECDVKQRLAEGYIWGRK